MKQELIIFTGNIGTGKSILAAKLAKKGYVVVNMDEITTMIQGGEYGLFDVKKKPIYHATEQAAIRTALENGFNVVVDRTNMKRPDRLRYLSLWGSMKQERKIISVDFGPGNDETLHRRLMDPKGIPAHQWIGVHQYMMDSYQKPDYPEGFDEILTPPEKYYFYAVDFDGTIVENEFPKIGPPIDAMINRMKNWWEDSRNIIIIWTCRAGDNLAEMKSWLLGHGVPFDFINENPIAYWGSPKIYANEYHDDRNG